MTTSSGYQEMTTLNLLAAARPLAPVVEVVAWILAERRDARRVLIRLRQFREANDAGVGDVQILVVQRARQRGNRLARAHLPQRVRHGASRLETRRAEQARQRRNSRGVSNVAQRNRDIAHGRRRIVHTVHQQNTLRERQRSEVVVVQERGRGFEPQRIVLPLQEKRAQLRDRDAVLRPGQGVDGLVFGLLRGAWRLKDGSNHRGDAAGRIARRDANPPQPDDGRIVRTDELEVIGDPFQKEHLVGRARCAIPVRLIRLKVLQAQRILVYPAFQQLIDFDGGDDHGPGFRLRGDDAHHDDVRFLDHRGDVQDRHRRRASGQRDKEAAAHDEPGDSPRRRTHRPIIAEEPSAPTDGAKSATVADMAFQLRSDESVADGLRRLARKELRNTRNGLRQESPPSDEAIHEARKSVKKVRAIAHLIDADDGKGLAASPKKLRRVSRTLSALRDVDAMIQMLTQLRERNPRLMSEHSFAPLERWLSGRRQLAMDAAVRDDVWSDIDRQLRKARRASARWRPAHARFGALAAGIRSAHKRGSKALARARDSGRASDFHEWRKEMKALWYSLRLIEDCAVGIRRNVEQAPRRNVAG